MIDPINPYAPPQSSILPASSGVADQWLASPWRRLGASLLDSLIMMVLTMPVAWLSGYFSRIMELAAQGRSWTPESLLWAVFGFGIMVAINWTHLGRGQTIGKGVMEMRIVRKDGSPAGRSHIILKRLLPIQLIALLPVVGGFFAVVDALCIFRTQRNTIHDDIAETKVIDLRPRPVV